MARNPPSPPFIPPTGLSVFEIGRATAFPSKRCLILAVCLPLVLILLFFSLDFRHAFSSVVPAGPIATSDRMREGELRALFLLRNQQLALMRANLSDVSLAEIKSSLLDQMRVNREIHDVLLSAHGIGNFSDSEFDFPIMVLKFAKKLKNRLIGEQIEEQIEWKPKKDQFLFAVCLSGQMSNHLICLEKHMFFAALLDRILILPSPKVDYEYSYVLHIEHINKCFG